MSKTLRERLKKTVAGFVAIATIVTLSGVVALAPAAQAATWVTGDLVRNPSASGMAQYDVYVVKVVGTKMFKRLILNPAIFNSYGGLFKWSNIKTVNTATMDSFKTSALVRVETGAPVYALQPTDDTGSKSWLNVSAADFVAASGDWDSIYVINSIDGAGYTAAADLTTQTQVSTFLTTGQLPGGAVATGVTVAVASDNPGSTTLTKSSVGNKVLSFAVTANDGDAVLNSVKLTRTGVGLSTDYSSVYIYDGAAKLKSGKSIASDTNTVEFTSIGLALAKGVTKVITVKADVFATAGTGDFNVMSIQAASDITVSAGTVTGTFPVSGNAMTIGSQSIGTSTVANGTSLAKPVIGQSGAKVANLKITAGANDIELKTVTLVQNGSFANTGIANLVLKNSVTGDVLGSASKMTGDKAVIVLTTTLPITKSQNKTVDLYADLSGGKTTDTIRFYLEETGDIIILDKQYGQNSAITNNFGISGANCLGSSTNTCPTGGSLQGGTITLSSNGPAAATVAKNTTNVDLFKFNMTATRNVTVKDYDVILEQTAWDGATAVQFPTAATAADPGAITMTTGTETAVITWTNGGTLVLNDYVKITGGTVSPVYAKVTTAGASGAAKLTPLTHGLSATSIDGTLMTEIYDNHLIANVKNVKLVDTDTNNVLASSATSAALIAFTDDFDFTAGQTRHLAIRADLDNNLVAANSFKAGVDFTVASTIKDNDANQYVATSDVIAGNIFGNVMTSGAASLTVARASTPVSTTKVKGTAGVDIIGISLVAGSSVADKMTSLVARFTADSDTTFVNGFGDTAANTVVSTASLYDGDTLVSGPKALQQVGSTLGTDEYFTATFDSLSYPIPAGASKKLTVRVDLKNTIAATTYLAATLAPATDVVAQDANGNSLTISNTADGSINEDDASATVMNDTTPPVIFTITAAGTLALSVEGSPSAALVVTGSTDVVMAKYKAAALNEAFIIDKLDIASDTNSSFLNTAESTNDKDLVRVGVRAGGVSYYGFISSGIAHLSGLNITVPSNGNTYIEVLADMNTIANGAASGDSPRIGIDQVQAGTNTFRAVGTGSSTTLNYTTLATVNNVSNVNAMTVRKTVPTVAKATGLSSVLTNGENTLFAFTVAADAGKLGDAGAPVSLKRVALSITGSNAALTTSNFKLFRGTTNITDKVLIYEATLGTLEGATDLITGTSANTVYILWDGTTEEIVSAGATNTYYVKATISGAATGYSISTYIPDDETALTTTTGVLAVGGYSSASSNFYHAAGTNVAANDIRDNAVTSVASAYAQTNTGVATFLTSDLTDEVRSYGTVTNGQTIILTETGAATNIIGAITGTLVSTGGFTCTAQDAANGGGSATTTIASILSILCTNSTTSSQVILNTAALGPDIGVQSTTITLTSGTYAAGTVVGVNDSDVGLPVNAATVAAGTVRNFVWSDNSNTSHALTTSDWTNGYLVNDLSTSSQTLTY